MIERIICAIMGHHYVIERVLNDHARKVGCTRCGNHWAMHDPTKSFVAWDEDFEEMYGPNGLLGSLPK